MLRDSYPSKEIIVVIDNPTKTSRDLAKKFANVVKFILNGERIGKVNALNEAVKLTTGDILLFLDSDVQIQTNRGSFMEILAREMNGIDILDIKKKIIRDSILSKLVHYEYLSSSLVSWIFSKKIGKCLGLNGAAFAIRRDVFLHLEGFRRTLVEDFDLATRSFLSDFSFKYTNKVWVLIKPQPNWRSWYKQRKRWSIATGIWLKDYYRQLARITIKKPQIILPSLLLMLPSLLLLSINYLIPETTYYHAASLVLFFLASYSSLTFPPFFLTAFVLPIAKNLAASAITYAIFSIIFFLSARKLGYYFNPVEFLGFYFIYSPIWVLMIAVGLLRVATHRDKIDLDWKV